MDLARARRLICASTLLALAVLATGCGSGGGASSSGTATVSVGVLPIADVAPVYLGVKKGFFADHHLKVQPHALQGGAAVASAVVGGSLQFGFGATANVLLAKAHNLPIQFVANGDQAAGSAADAWSGIMVKKGSSITSIKDLAGKKIAANATQGENELALDAILLKNGVDPSSVHVVAVDFPTMPSALASGQVDAVTEVEPFVSAIKASGGSMLSPLFEGAAPSQMVAGYFTTSKEIQQNPTVVKEFVAAMNQSLDYAQAHPAEVRAIIPTYTKIPSAVATKMKLPAWGSTIDTASIATQSALMHKLGWLTSEVPASSVVWSGSKH